MNNFLLDILALTAIISGILVITSKNPVISVLFLISVFVNVAGYLVLLGVGFIGISYIVVYVGAVTVLFLFVIMMINIELSELNAAGAEYTQNVPLAFIIGSALFYEFMSVIPFTEYSGVKSNVFLGFITSANSAISHSENITTTSDITMTFNNIVPDIMFATNNMVGNGLQVQSIGTMLYTHGSI
ncbi:UNVERIFIED_CONTAM: NADH-ubiquinone oxidoreductase chain 6 [Trichonephila clavipes]